MPPGGAFLSSHTGLDSPISVPEESNTWVRTKLSAAAAAVPGQRPVQRAAEFRSPGPPGPSRPRPRNGARPAARPACRRRWPGPPGHRRERAQQHPEQFVIPGRPADQQYLGQRAAERAQGPAQVRGEHGLLEPQPYRPPLGRAVLPVEWKQPGRPRRGEHPRRRGRRGPVQETAAPVFGFEPLAAVYPQARAALDPVRRGARYPQGLRDRGGEQVPGARGDHLAVRRDHIHRAGAEVHHDGIGPRSRRGEGAEPGRRWFGQHAVHRQAEQVRQHRRVVGAVGHPAQRRDQRRGAQPAAPCGGGVRHLGQVEGEQVVHLDRAVPGAERAHRADRPAGNQRARRPQRDPLPRRYHPRPAVVPRAVLLPRAGFRAGFRARASRRSPRRPGRRGRPRRWRSRRASGTAPPRPRPRPRGARTRRPSRPGRPAG